MDDCVCYGRRPDRVLYVHDRLHGELAGVALARRQPPQRVCQHAALIQGVEARAGAEKASHQRTLQTTCTSASSGTLTRTTRNVARSRGTRCPVESPRTLGAAPRVSCYLQRPTSMRTESREIAEAAPDGGASLGVDASMLKSELYNEARNAGIEGRSAMNKEQLVEALRQRQDTSSPGEPATATERQPARSELDSREVVPPAA